MPERISSQVGTTDSIESRDTVSDAGQLGKKKVKDRTEQKSGEKLDFRGSNVAGYLKGKSAHDITIRQPAEGSDKNPQVKQKPPTPAPYASSNKNSAVGALKNKVEEKSAVAANVDVGRESNPVKLTEKANGVSARPAPPVPARTVPARPAPPVPARTVPARPAPPVPARTVPARPETSPPQDVKGTVVASAATQVNQSETGKISKENRKKLDDLLREYIKHEKKNGYFLNKIVELLRSIFGNQKDFFNRTGSVMVVLNALNDMNIGYNTIDQDLPTEEVLLLLYFACREEENNMQQDLLNDDSTSKRFAVGLSTYYQNNRKKLVRLHENFDKAHLSERIKSKMKLESEVLPSFRQSDIDALKKYCYLPNS